MKILKFGFFASVFALVLLQCKTAAQVSKIQSITFTNTYGRGGSTSVTVTKDSLQSIGNGRRNSDYPKISKKISENDWKTLVSAINISTLEKTKSGKRRGVYDGNDELFNITTTDKEYEIINASDDAENYKQLETLKTNINNLLSKYK